MEAIDNNIETVKLIIKDKHNNLSLEDIKLRWANFATQQPKLFDLALSDENCLEKLNVMKLLMKQKDKGYINDYEASVKFGKYMGDKYLPK